MESGPIPRKLAAILYADVAGYSRLTGDDEDATHRRLADYLDQMTVTIERHGGRVMHYAGDAVLAMFDAVVDAIFCAAHIQKDLETRNEDLPDERKVQFRIGVNLGDVIEDRGDIYGDGVNVAARLESLAEPGGICISESVHTAVGSKLPFDYEFLGEQAVKNIAKPVKAYHARVKPGATLPTPTARPKPRRPKHHMAAIAAAVVLTIGAGVIAWWQPWQTREEPASLERMAFPLPEKPSVAVLPFDNMTGDPKQDYFVDGITGGIITMLAKVPQLFVTARNSTFAYKDKPVPVRQVAEELGVHYVLEGSVQRSEHRIRLNAQLIDALTGHHVWAERYNLEPADILTIQDQVAEKVVAALEVALTEGEQRRVRRAETSSPEAYDYYVRARQTYLNFTEADILQARQLWLKAFELDPKYAGALASVGYSHAMAVLSGFSDDPAQDLKQARAYAEQSLAIDDTNPDAYALMARLATFNHEHEQAVEYAQRSVELSPSHADNTALLGLFLSYAGRYAEALQVMNRAMRLAPHYPNWYPGIVGAANRFLGNLDEAINAFEQERDRTPNSHRPYIWLASTYAEAGREEAARTAAKEVLARNPKFSIKQYGKFQAWKNSEDLERLLDGLRKAGLPE